MSMPPQGGWPPQQPPPYGQPIDPSAFNPQQQPPPPGWQQGAWPQPSPPQQKGSSVKWLLIAVAVLLVIAMSVGVTLIFTRDSGGGDSPSAAGAASDIASAGDTGPVSIITQEPTCQAFVGINNRLGDVQTKGWSTQRRTLGPVSEWTADQRTQVQAVATAMQNAADQAVALAKQTPHRVVRELYEQFIVYGRAYADSAPSYVPSDDGLASANVNASSAIVGICNTITYGSAARGLALAPAPTPTKVAIPANPSAPERFVTESDATCLEWVSRLDRFNADTSRWANADPNTPASQWTPERRAIEEAVQPLLTAYANAIDAAGRQSGNPTLEDFATAGALYIGAYLSVGDSYTAADAC